MDCPKRDFLKIEFGDFCYSDRTEKLFYCISSTLCCTWLLLVYVKTSVNTC